MSSPIIYGVFVSSTYEDLREERAEVEKALLKLRCFPIGMELFTSADEETWDFIKRQIEECDYYVVIVADRYGSLAPDGLSFTEKEYDYAKAVGKPILAFLHGSRGNIPRDKIEIDAKKRRKLKSFIQKISRSPVSFFNTPQQLATEVTVSFVNLRDRRPAVGFIRANQAADPKKYADLLEQKIALEAELADLKAAASIEILPKLSGIRVVRLIRQRYPKENAEFSVTYQDIFLMISYLISTNNRRRSIMNRLPAYIVKSKGESPIRYRTIKDGTMETDLKFTDEEEYDSILAPLFAWGLMTSGITLVSGDDRQVTVPVVNLTDFGQKQFGLLVPASK
jgi:hypothetical protein